MANKDYYQILGVDDKADATTIKKKYRKLAKEYHPDAHPGDKTAEMRFKEISEAYNVLSDPAKRKRYDQMRKFGFRGAPSDGFNHHGHEFDFGDVFGQARGRRQPRSGDFNLDDLFGLGGLGDLFGQIFERPHAPHAGRSGFGNPRDIHATLEIPFETATLGGKAVFSVPEKNGKQFSLSIPPGTENGRKLRLPGQGRASTNGAPSGDLIVSVRVRPHRFFKCRGQDIYCEIPVARSLAAKGTRVRVKTIHGSTVELNIPPDTRQGKTFRLKGLGLKSKAATGDQYVKIRLKDGWGEDGGQELIGSAAVS